MAKKRIAVTNDTKPSLLLNEQLCFAVYSTGLAMNKLYRKLLRNLDLTYPQYLVMLVLWEQDQVNVSEIGKQLFLDSATLTPLLKRMETASLITRVRAADDDRHVIITLTAKGRNLKQRAKDVPHAVLCASECTTTELVALTGQLDLLRMKLMKNA